MHYNWNWAVIVTAPYYQWLLDGLGLTLTIASCAAVIAFGIGGLIGTLRTLDVAPLRLAATAYVELFRNVPLLVQLFVWFFVVPELLPRSWGHYIKRDLPNPEITTAIICMGLYQGASIAETVRAGIQSIGRGQTFAGLAIGLRMGQVYRYILMPVALRTIIPPLASTFLSTVKDSSLALTIGVLELTAQSRQIETYTFQGFEAFFAATVLYQAITVIVIFSSQYIERCTRFPGMTSLADK